jgi:hypothetical protein
VGDLVVTRFEHLIGGRERGYVPGDAHPEAMRLFDHRRHPRGVHAVVDLDLPVAACAVPANRVERLLLAVEHEAVVGAERALAFDEARTDDVGPRDLSGLDPSNQRIEHRVVIAHVAHAGDAGLSTDSTAAICLPLTTTLTGAVSALVLGSTKRTLRMRVGAP